MTEALTHPDLPLPRVHRGKVREVYEVDDERLLMVASDRVSAFDVVMSEGVPFKGQVLTQLTAWWLSQLEGVLDHHLLSAHPATIRQAVPALSQVPEDAWAGRTMLVRRTHPLPVECVVRGYISGSAWKEYEVTGTLAGEPLPRGLVMSGRLPQPIFSPATKAVEGHDENITYDIVCTLLGEEVASELRERSKQIYQVGVEVADAAGIILADTKFEFGLDREGRLRLIDEVLTPDSSRYWPAATYAPGGIQESLDKQPVRDYLETLDWDKQPPPPPLAPEVVEDTTRRYLEIFETLTGESLADYEPARTLGDR